ncbi:MAG: putative transporter [Candidatus Hydrogenedentes bacterium]|nr:putative transporter [Candidatus Hydrogenedentota bacterium]
MIWIQELFKGESIAGTVAILALVAVVGLVFGSLKLRGVGLGIAGVLFSGLLFGHLKFSVNPEMMEFAREFGLILFVYSIGMQVGPGIIDSLRREGLPMNLLAAGVVLLGAATALVLGRYFNVEMPVIVGLLSGATTNTPSLGAAQAAIFDSGGAAELLALPGLGYAVAYPFGIVGIILSMLFLRFFFRVKVAGEAAALKQARAGQVESLERSNLAVENPNLEGMPLGEISLFEDSGVIISRVQHEGIQSVATPKTVLHLGDIVLAVGPPKKLHALKLLVGQKSAIDLSSAPSAVESKKLIVTKNNVVGKTLRELALPIRFNVRVTRLLRAGVEMPIVPSMKLHYGDTIVTVGDKEHLDQVASIVGNSKRALNHPEMLPVFIGIVLGVIVGSIPFHVPGVPAPVKLGLAGGPLLVAIVLSRLGNVGNVVWYLPDSASLIIRELGIVLFLSCVGLKAGNHLMETLVNGDGLLWVFIGAMITMVPLIVIGAIARVAMKMNFLSVCGLLAGSMTDPPALAFAGNFAGSEGPTVAYATVYPLTMILRVIIAQVLILMFL